MKGGSSCRIPQLTHISDFNFGIGVNLLQRFDLLPPAPSISEHLPNGHRRPITPEQRQDLLNQLDRRILSSAWFQTKVNSGAFPEPEHTMPYILRAAALDEPLEPHMFGRALDHLGQRRGFLSNRKQAPKKNDDEGAVKEGIAELRKAMQTSGARTLGEYFSRLNPSTERIRRRWTSRDMYEKEFNAIWDAQAPHHADLLTPERKKQIYDTIFFQRPLWLDPGTVGNCELEPGEKRAPAYLLVSQRFRLLQTVNHLRVLPPDDVDMPLTPTDRKKLVDALETKGDLTFKEISKLLKLEKGYKFNLESGGEKRIKGNRTNADFYAAFGERWLAMSPEERDRVVEYVNAFQKPEKLKAAARRKFNLTEEQAEKLADISLESDYEPFPQGHREIRSPARRGVHLRRGPQEALPRFICSARARAPAAARRNGAGRNPQSGGYAQPDRTTQGCQCPRSPLRQALVRASGTCARPEKIQKTTPNNFGEPSAE